MTEPVDTADQTQNELIAPVPAVWKAPKKNQKNHPTADVIGDITDGMQTRKNHINYHNARGGC